MGLDLLDVNFRIEKEFKVCLTHEDYENIRTVGDLEEFIASRMTSVWPCPHIPAFSKLSEGLSAVTTLPVNKFNLKTNLNQLTSDFQRAQFWNKLERETGLKLPPMTPSPALGLLGCMTVFLLLSLPFVYVLETANNLALRPEYVFVLVPIAICVALIFIKFAPAMASFISQRYEFACPNLPTPTLRELTHAVASINRDRLVTPISTHYDPIWSRLVELLEDVTGYDQEESIPTARFVEDLGF